MESTTFRAFPKMTSLLLGAAMALGATSGALAQANGEGPTTLFLSYKCEPKHRAAFRAHMEGAGVARFEQWKKEGVFTDHLILFSSVVNTRELDMLVRLDFPKYVGWEKWKAVERSMPGGLSPEALALCSPDTAYMTDLGWTGVSPSRNLPKATYLYIPYHLEKGVGKPDYAKYFETYVKPQNDGWIAEKALSWWGVYVNQHNTGSPWDVLFLYEYSDMVGLARRDNVKTSVRDRLKSIPAWKAVSDNKQSYRIEDQVIFMDPILSR